VPKAFIDPKGYLVYMQDHYQLSWVWMTHHLSIRHDLYTCWEIPFPLTFFRHVTIQEKVNVAENSVLFGARSLTIGITQSIFKTENLSDFEMALAGSGAAFFSSIAVCPTELIKTRMQAATELRDTGTFVNKEKVTIRSTFRQVLNEVSAININRFVDYGFIITHLISPCLGLYGAISWNDWNLVS